jgi:hypothetical protein
MRVLVGIDDTDVIGADRGTGKLARRFQNQLPEGVTVYGIVRQQLPALAGIAYTSRNSSACLILENVDSSQVEEIIDRAAGHIRANFIDGSDPGLCVVSADAAASGPLLDFGRLASNCVVSQKAAMRAARGFHLSGHGGSNDGIIGAAAGVGLTLCGWGGRFIAFNGLRRFAKTVKVAALEAHGIRVLPVDRDARFPGPEDLVDTRDWLRPRLWGGHPVLPVASRGWGRWRAIAGRRKQHSRRINASDA